jgi:eukaryotic-like serine/threonine-protein kinase
MAIHKGVSLGPYEILTQIGAGGMGEVWRARDKRIGRDVAVKVLPESFTHGDDVLWRFEQEARAAGGLNHPGLVTIFDVGTTDGSPYIVMELLEGETLRNTIDKALSAPLPVRKVIDYATQIASALAVAHEKGIIHRDLKPENLFLTADGRVKILDFGLAKLAAEAAEAGGHGQNARRTSAGIVVGTPGYMSPEQASGHALDHRTDIFSLGSVVYELLSGRPAFDCMSAIETMHAVLTTEPPPLPAIVENIPPALDAIVCHCMEKNPRERFQSARDLAFQLRMLPEVQSTIPTQRRQPLEESKKRRPSRAALAATALVLTVAGGGFAFFRVLGGEAPAAQRTFRQLTFGDGLESFPTLAPDGKSFAYVSAQSGNRDIYVQRVDGRTATNLTSDSPEDDSQPAFSPDGSQIAFRSERDGGGIFLMGVTGESVRRLTNMGFNPAWSPDGTRIAISTVGTDLKPHVHPANGDLWIVETTTGATRELIHASAGIAEGASDALQPSWSPRGRRIAYWGLSSKGERDIWTIDPDAPQPKSTAIRVTSDPAIHWNPVWSPDGAYLYYGSDRDGTLNLWRVAMDEETGKPRGAAEPVPFPGSLIGHLAFSQRGDLAFASILKSHRLLAIPFDPSSGATGSPHPLFGGTQEILSFEPSPDEQFVAFTTGGVQEDLFIVNSDGTRMRQLTNDHARDRHVTWSHDGKMLYFYSNRKGANHIWSINADGSGLTRVTDDADLRRIGVRNIYLPNASPDGRTLVVQTDRSHALVHLDRPLGQRLEAIVPDLGTMPSWSPDGKQIVGDPENALVIYSPGARQVRTILRRDVARAQWLADGRNIVFFDRRRVGSMDVESGREKIAPFVMLPGVQFDFTSVMSRDGSTLYARQTLEQGDIWVAHFAEK